MKLNCAAIPTGLLESELFGHEKGAFTGAIAQRIGRFELASEGIIFLDAPAEVLAAVRVESHQSHSSGSATRVRFTPGRV